MNTLRVDTFSVLQAVDSKLFMQSLANSYLNVCESKEIK